MPIPKQRKNLGRPNRPKRVMTVGARYPFVNALPACVKAAGKAVPTMLRSTQGSVISPEEAAENRSRYAESNARTAILLHEMKAAHV